MPQTLILLSPLAKRGGNYCTIKRIRQHLKSVGYKCHLEDPKQFQSPGDFSSRLNQGNIGVLIGIHAIRTGPFMMDSKMPYILILGGTDINEFSKDTDSMEIMTEVVNRARFVVCFSQTIVNRTLKLWPLISVSKLALIPQAVHLCMSSFNLMNYLSNQLEASSSMTSSHKPIIFIFVGGIRPVKNPTFLISTFQDWHARNNRILYLIVGPKLDEDYFTSVFEPAIKSRPGIVYIPGCSMEDSQAMISQSFALVNTSDSEGMCLAILEAMAIGIPVLARSNPGNLAIVDDRVTGIIFDSPQTFLEEAEYLVQSAESCDILSQNAKQYVKSHHSLEEEKKKYLDLVGCCIKDLLPSSQDGQVFDDPNSGNIFVE